MAVTATEFRRLALTLPDAMENSHMGHADFRVGGKIFATLGYPDGTYGMVKLTPMDQARYVAPDTEAFMPAKGAWGKQGATVVKLKAVNRRVLKEAMQQAWANVAPRARSAEK